MAAITSTGDVQVDSVLLPSVRRRFGDAELIFQNDDDAYLFFRKDISSVT